MNIADFHNDILTCGDGVVTAYGEDRKTVTALFRGKRTFSEICKIANNSKSRYLAFEDVGYYDFNFDTLIRFSPVYVGLTWNGENRFGYGCNYLYGLKNEGINLVKKLSAEKIAIDVAHLSKGGFIDVIENADRVVDSHTCFSGVYRHKRNIEDWQIRILVEKNGLIGVTLCGYFSTNEKELPIEKFARQIDYYCQRFPIKNLCLGTDFYGCDFLPCGITEDYSSLSVLKEELFRLGYPEKAVEDIFYNNLSEFLDKI